MTINCTVQFINLHWILDFFFKQGLLSKIGYMCFFFSIWSDQWYQTAPSNSTDVSQLLLEVTVMEVEGNTWKFTIFFCPGKLPLQWWRKAHSNENWKGEVTILSVALKRLLRKTLVMPVKHGKISCTSFVLPTYWDLTMFYTEWTVHHFLFQR